MDSKLNTFWSFLNNNRIEIPIIQRDYAQGRNGKENLRKTFLANLKQALDGKLPNGEKFLKLDFVYGTKENSKMQPLDGQQRLTTLWLLHWYIALMAGEMESAFKVLANFGYETRMSSREFCEQMSNSTNFTKFKDGHVVDYITTRTWFYAAWKQDPTIQSMLQMLSGTKVADNKNVDIIDGIEELFEGTSSDDFRNYWLKLTDDNCPIVFYYQELKDFGLSDDLYIKMNARGKQLTSFENFKADLVGYIEQNVRDCAGDESEMEQWESLLSPAEGLPVKFDTVWMDIFWKNHSMGVKVTENEMQRVYNCRSHQVDEIYFTFINRFFWNELFTARNNNSYILNIGKDEDSSVQENKNSSYRYLNDSSNKNPNDRYEIIAYEGLDIYKYFNGEIPWAFFDCLKRILDNYSKYLESSASIPQCKWNSDFNFIPEYVEENGYNIGVTNNKNDTILKVASLSQVERVAFFALCKYFEKDAGDNESLRRWMRVVWNLISGQSEDNRPLIRTTQAVRNAIEFLEKLDSHNVYQSLSLFNVSDINNGAFKFRCIEEIEKAKKIISDPNFEAKIIDAEGYASFKGSISFLFIDSDGNIDWKDFDEKYTCLQKIMDGNGLKKDYRNGAKAIKLILSYCESWEKQIESYTHNNHYIFGTSFDCWKNSILLRTGNDGKYLYAKSMHNLLMGNDVPGNGPLDLRDDSRKSAYSKLMNTKLIEKIYDSHSEKYYIRWIYNNLCLYPSSEGFILSMPERDSILKSCIDNKIIELRNYGQLSDGIFWGWYVNFRCNNHCFIWCYDGYVYLADENYNYVIKDDKATNDNDKYCRFFPNKNISSNDVIVELNKLVSSKQITMQ